MAAKITLLTATLAAVPGVNQTATVMYRLTSAPDVPGSYTTVTTSAPILPNGTFSPSVVIGSLLYNTSYTVRTINNCDESTVDKVFVTPLPSCVQITDIIGTTGEE